MWGAFMIGGRQTSLSGQITCDTFGNNGQFQGYSDASLGGDSGGSTSPDMIDGFSIVSIRDNINSGVGIFALSGFSADPGAAFLQSLKVGSVTRFGVDASYAFTGSAAIWTWTAGVFGIPPGGVTNWTIRLVG
jgi:hypothetical protein